MNAIREEAKFAEMNMELGDTSVRSILYSCEIYRGSGASCGCENYGGRDRSYENDDGKQFMCTHRRMITLWRAVAFFDGLERGRKQKKQNGDRKCHHCRIQGYLKPDCRHYGRAREECNKI
jgi:hypothetical protein